MITVTVGLAVWVIALVTSSLVSRIAMSESTGTSQAHMAARICLRASAAASGPPVSGTRHWWSWAVRAAVMAFIGFLTHAGHHLQEKWCCKLH